MDKKLLISFWKNVNVVSSGCWEWVGCLHQSGYGDFRFRGLRIRAHRLSWELEHGRKPKDCILHRCDNRKCVNPEHLFEGSRLDNSKDAVAKGRHSSQVRTHCPHGHLYSLENTYIHKNGSRRCKTCNKSYYLTKVKVWEM